MSPELQRPSEPPRQRGADDQSWPPASRLRRRSEFLRVQRGGRRVHTPHFVVIVRPAGPGALRRLGITVTKKVANAVGRNRVKRVLREVFRRNRSLFPDSCEIVVIAKSGAPRLGYAEALEELSRAHRPMARAASAPPPSRRPRRRPPKTKPSPKRVDEP